ncbi:MAG TPA: sensor domain-containing diguanylate cyclase [Azonexus sp.]|nr:sensor domain-containing diguanylate cyclase [Azonexus sp.]
MQFRSELRSKRHYASFLIAWLALCLFGLYMVISSEIKQAEQQFNQDIHELSADIRQKLLANEAVLSGFSAFLQAVEETNQGATALYAAAALAPYPHIYMLEVARKISSAEKSSLENSIREAGQRTFSIRSFSDSSRGPEIKDTSSETYWPIVFIFPTLPNVQEIYGIRLETVPHLEETLRIAARSGRAIASPGFPLKEGGNAFILLRNVVRPTASNKPGAPNLFGSSMVALLLNKTDSLLPANLASKDLGMNAEFLNEASREPSTLFQKSMPPAHWLDSKMLPRFTQIVDPDITSQPVRLTFERQLRWAHFFGPSVVAVVSMLLAGMLLVTINVRRHHQVINTAAIEHERTEHLAMHDALTRLPNRHLLTDRFDQVLHRWQRHGTKFALFVIDLDHFKKINDSLGHDAGDAVLVATAARITQAIRAGDTVARYGGDEFIVLIADVLSQEDALGLGEKLCDLLREPVSWGKASLQPTCSLGIALCPDDGDNFKSLFQQADQAMYQVKERGRNGALLAKAH